MVFTIGPQPLTSVSLKRTMFLPLTRPPPPPSRPISTKPGRRICGPKTSTSNWSSSPFGGVLEGGSPGGQSCGIGGLVETPVSWQFPFRAAIAKSQLLHNNDGEDLREEYRGLRSWPVQGRAQRPYHCSPRESAAAAPSAAPGAPRPCPQASGKHACLEIYLQTIWNPR